MIRRRVLHFIDTTGPGGAETVFLETASGLRERGWDPHTVAVGPGWVLDSIRRRNLPVTLLETSGRMDLRYALGIRSAARAHGASLIHAHLFSPAVYASLVGATTGIPVVASFHGDSDAEDGGWTRRLRYRLIDRNATVVCVSEALRSRLASLNMVRAERIRVIHNGVDVKSFSAATGRDVRREYDIDEDTILVGAVGNVRPAKDYGTLLRAAAALASDRRYLFAIAGERTDPLFSELIALRDQLNLSDRVSFWGFREDIADVIAAFDVMVISSESEGFSLAAIQAMAAGTPVVATRSGGPEGIMTHEADGLLVPVGDAAALAAAVQRVIEDRSLRDRLTGRARSTVAQRFSMAAMLDGYEDLYCDLTGLSTPSTAAAYAAGD